MFVVPKPQMLLSMDDKYKNKFPQSLLYHNNIHNDAYINKNNLKFHLFIEKCYDTMIPCFVNNPQLCRSQAIDVYKNIYALGQFVNPVSKKCIFKNRRHLDTNDTIIKLNRLRLGLLKYSRKNFLDEKGFYEEFFFNLDMYIETIIKYIIKKEADRLLFHTSSVLKDANYFIEFS